MAGVLDEPPEISFEGLLGSMIERRSVFLYTKLETSDYLMSAQCSTHWDTTYLSDIANGPCQGDGRRLVAKVTSV